MPEALETINHFQWTETFLATFVHLFPRLPSQDCWGAFDWPVFWNKNAQFALTISIPGIFQTSERLTLFQRATSLPDLQMLRCSETLKKWFLPVYSIYSYSGIRSKKLAFTKTRIMGNKETWMGNAHGEKGSEKKWGKKHKGWLMRLLKQLWFKLGPIYRFPVPIFSFPLSIQSPL